MKPDTTRAERALVTVEDLRISFGRGSRRTEVVHGVDLTLRAGECLALVGESGSGKTLTGRTLAGLTGPGATVTARTLDFDGRDLTALDERAWRRLRGAEIGLVLQDALVSLDPLRRVGAEIEESLANHGIGTRRDRPDRAVELLREVAVPAPERRARQFPHQLSGGQRQRALIASALAAGPRVLIADEPTTALDTTVQAQILDLLAARRDAGTALLLISHDLAAVARLADRIAVMRDGRIVESGPAAKVLAAPAHPYTRRLLDAVPDARAARRPSAGSGGAGTEVLRADGLVKRYAGPGGGTTALDGVSCVLHAGETLGVLGESGSGKSTLARIVLGLTEPDQGSVTLLGRPWSGAGERSRAALRGRIQLVQQDPLSSFDPRWTVERIVAEALGAGGRRAARRHRERVVELLGLVGMGPELLDRGPRGLSGGQRQRVAVARALAPEPDVLVCDEPVSALDVSVQAQVLEVFERVREQLGVALLFISHDLGVVRRVSDRVAVMRAGGVVETGPSEQVFTRPEHPWTRELLGAATPVAVPDRQDAGRPA
ncbi:MULTISPECIES: dipeptide ABC transporter ATP-binding protein [Streptomyces]|uniref:ABC transporter ATP-binding protein n=3 Tax=Streptomyces cinereoruber TaxID=67260 RepID=A0ABX6B9L0_9ACTN|nr:MULTISPECIES: ABC transporter ATP-binding protein [Streptomyces]AVH98577.1 ABC transporter ATP-binding protein [Streptomyces sp. WAC00288]MBB4160783.1 peptide/nickel transport system ATP-binding protein [Streptomyces cinereoruber]MBY8820604.1 ABC transporter ATP-binding protein [Streptomyces cinereoruber]NIH62698.1 peptide/nickel transport system ATP-binding protein [Streptomyces cinereoruber]QEV31694.1 ABC transporter ATP-binding protein [Streptomyces cinereoruber]